MGSVTADDRPSPETLLARTRGALARRGVQTTEKRMFGEVALMTEGEIVVSTRRSGGLLVRCDAVEHDALTALPGARTARMGARSMGAGWIEVDGDAIADDAALDAWVDAALRRRG